MANVYKAWYDANCEGHISLADVSIFLANVGPNPNALYDVNGDGSCTLVDVSIVLQATEAAVADKTQPLRDKYQWPFSSDSIWNLPLARGNEAHFVAAGFTTVDHVGADENIIINTPTASPLIPLWKNNIDWLPNADDSLNPYITVTARERTDAAAGGVDQNDTVAWPLAYILPGGDFPGDTPNWCTAVIRPDLTSVQQFQPPTHGQSGSTPPPPSASATNTITAYDIKTDLDIKANDVLSVPPAAYGSHGGSGMSALGGCIRIGELTPANTNGFIRHVLKLEANSEQYYSVTSGAGGGIGYRWPATQADQCATDNPSCYGGAVTQTQPGSLVALKTSFVVKNLKTLPGKIIARTLMRYGAYLVDSTSATNVFHLCTERGTAGRVAAPRDPGTSGVSDEFYTVWGGHGIGTDNMWPDWQADMSTIIKALFVVDNNAPTAIGGPTIAGTSPALRLAPPAPAFSN